jgi:hypothetical protein
LTISQPDEQPDTPLGEQQPRISWIPPCATPGGEEVLEAAALAGLFLDPWQEYALLGALGERSDGKWAAKEAAVVCSRQNGKGGIIEAREIGGLFVLGEKMIIHSAHMYDTSMEAFRRLLNLIEDTPDYDKRVARVIRSHGEEGIELKTGQRIRFRTRTKGGGRGFSCDCLILDEAMILPEAMHGALMPTLAARDDETLSGTQVWYLGSAVDEDVHEQGAVFARIRERGMAGGDERLAFFEWSADPDLYERDPSNVAGWAQANPGLGIRISLEHVAVEQRSMDARTFATERLGIGHWPAANEHSARVVNPDAWAAAADEASFADGFTVFAVEVTPDRERATIGVAAMREDELAHLAVEQSGAGVDWVAPACVALQRLFRRKTRFLVDARSAAGALIPDLKAAKIDVFEVGTAQCVQACGAFLDALRAGKFRYVSSPELDAAAAAITVRPLGDAWAWERRSLIDVTPLTAASLALWGLHNLKPKAAGVVNWATVAKGGLARQQIEQGIRCPKCLGRYDEGGAMTHNCQMTGWRIQ